MNMLCGVRYTRVIECKDKYVITHPRTILRDIRDVALAMLDVVACRMCLREVVGGVVGAWTSDR